MASSNSTDESRLAASADAPMATLDSVLESCGLIPEGQLGKDLEAEASSADRREGEENQAPEKQLADQHDEVEHPAAEDPLEEHPKVVSAEQHEREESPTPEHSPARSATPPTGQIGTSQPEVLTSQPEGTLEQMEAPQFISIDDNQETVINDFVPPDPVVQIDPQIGSSSGNTSRVLSLGPLPDDARAKLRDMLPLLNQDIGQLVQDAEPIRDIFKTIRGHLSRDITEKLIQVAFIENRQLQVLDAQNRLEDRVCQERIFKNREAHDSRVTDLDGRIQLLSTSRADIVSSIDRLKRRRADLMKELQQVGEDLAREEKRLEDLPSTIADMERRKAILPHKAQALRREERPIPCSADADRREIDEVDQLR
ncbi:hypothetical protein PVAP13_7NG115951 [Panicum virgatum]|uniref:DUF1409 domain-containing protein n=1 Tax=Panicum virgatum TaxID=38727 RepID=A0A8T0Q380_PANVG|nr:hypothetical protein PVAP13_7NG115951 [Panicum virgatum]